MTNITSVGRVMVPVADQDAGIRFYTEELGFTVAADIPFGEGERWVEVAPPAGGANLALVPGRGDYQPGRNTGIALQSSDVRAAHEDFQARGITIDEPGMMGGDGLVPPMFFFRDPDGNVLLLVQQQES